MVGVGILYQEGYFRQYLSADGYQQEDYPINDYSTLPVTRVLDADGNILKIKVPMPNREMTAQIWRVQVGRIPLFLLDSNLPENIEEDRDLTDRLYGGDRRTRIRQEVLMGIGGMRALEAMALRAGGLPHERRPFRVSVDGAHPDPDARAGIRLLVGLADHQRG
jgi:starch phosphorylase